MRFSEASGWPLTGLAAWLVFTFIAGIAFFDRELWGDEAITLLAATGHLPAQVTAGVHDPADLRALYTAVEAGPHDVWNTLSTYDNHTPGYPVLISAGLWLTGAQTLDANWLRLANIAATALFVFAAIPLAARLGSRMHWLPLILIVLSPFAFYAARELRAYGLILILTLWAPLLCLRLKDGQTSPMLFLAMVLPLNLVGCALHKLFLGVVAAEIAFLVFLAFSMPERRRQYALVALAVAAVTLAGGAFIPNLLATAPVTSPVDTAWLLSAPDLGSLAEGFTRYLAYFLSWWMTPVNDPFASAASIAFVVAFVPVALFLLYAAIREAIRLRPSASSLLFVAVPLAFMMSIHVVMGVDLSRAPRFSVIWMPFAAIWLSARLQHLPLRRLMLPWAALATVTSSALVLTNLAHTSPDGTRGFVTVLPDSGPGKLIWLRNGTLQGKALLLALDSELHRAGKLPEQYEIVPVSDFTLPQTGNAPAQIIVAGSRRQADQISGVCATGRLFSHGEYTACLLP